MCFLIAGLPLLVSCGPDPGDLAAYEHAEVSSRASIGLPLNSAIAALVAYGYQCSPMTGNFVTESGETRSVPSFVLCSKLPKEEPVCSIRTQVILVPIGGSIEQIHFQAGDACL